MPDHSALWSSESEAKLQDGVYLWGRMVLKAKDLGLHKLEKTRDAQGDKARLLITQVIMKRIGADLQFGW